MRRLRAAVSRRASPSAATSRRISGALEEEGLLHRAGDRFHWTSETYPADHISLRAVTSDNFLVIDTTAEDARQVKRRQIIAEVDWKSAFAMIYPKAIYMVEGEPFEVQELHYREDEEKVAYVKRVAVDYFTDAVSAKGVWILQRLGRQETPGLLAEQGEVLVAEKVVGFKKIKMGTLENVGAGEVELPQQEMQTTSVWLSFDPGAVARRSRRAGMSCWTGCARSPASCIIWRRSSSSAISATWGPGWATARRRRRASWSPANPRGRDCARPRSSPPPSTSTTTSPAASGSPSGSSRCCPICWREVSRRSGAAAAGADARPASDR